MSKEKFERTKPHVKKKKKKT
ncbi:hypothetical protein K796_24146, partial [Salmonella enterica subsp. enterica serovar Newport str. SHSN006]